MRKENKIRLKTRLTKGLARDWEETNKFFLGGASSFAMGAGLGAVGRSTNQLAWYLTLPGMTLLGGGNAFSPSFLLYYAGIALNYVPEIYLGVRNLAIGLDKLVLGN